VSGAFPKNFETEVRTILKRMFRVYAHIYHSHLPHIKSVGSEAHLNTCFKHFVYFVGEFGLVDAREMVRYRFFCVFT
jgi:MOB kinase activator 1